MTKVTTLFAAGALMAMAGNANAFDINIYGASAQYNFWKTASDGFLKNVVGCPAGNVSAGYETSDKKQFIRTGTGCAGNGDYGLPAGDYTIRSASKASYDGVFAAKGFVGSGADNSCGTSGGNEFKRKFLVASGATTTACYDVLIGASDVSGEAFVQRSEGLLKGPKNLATDNPQTTRSFTGVDTSDLPEPFKPVKVPFAFFVNKGVTAKYCTAGTKTQNGTVVSMVGQPCVTSADCGDNGACGTAVPVDNLNRLKVVALFSQQILNWSDLGQYFTSQPVVVCLRHAGSGTHAAIDTAVMHNSWGAPLPSKENSQFTGALTPFNNFKPKTYFNDGSSDMMYCVNTQAGAIGYADADQALSSYANVTGPIKYQGVLPSKAAIIYGNYDFWANQHMYYSVATSEDTEKMAAVQSVYDYINNADNLNAAGYGGYWVTEDEIMFKKDSDFDYPSHK